MNTPALIAGLIFGGLGIMHITRGAMMSSDGDADGIYGCLLVFAGVCFVTVGGL